MCNRVNSKIMIVFPSTSTSVEAVTILTSLVICSLASLLLNPVVFLFNKRRNSVASFMFCVLSLLDILTCVLSPVIVFFYAATIDAEEENMKCDDIQTFPLNCYKIPASKVNVLLNLVCWFLWDNIIITSGVMTAVRYLQIRHPFLMITRKRVALSLILFIFIDNMMILIFSLIFTEKTIFSPATYTVFVYNPFEFETEPLLEALSWLILNICVIITGTGAIIFSILTLVHLKKCNRISSNTRTKKGLSCIKIILMNLTNLLFLGVRLAMPVIILLVENKNEHQLISLTTGWTMFSLYCLTPAISSAWNPIIFISLSPNCRTFIRELYHDKRKEANVTQLTAQ